MDQCGVIVHVKSILEALDFLASF
jgi:hypothetical protein